jgi:hypothetical protein
MPRDIPFLLLIPGRNGPGMPAREGSLWTRRACIWRVKGR